MVSRNEKLSGGEVLGWTLAGIATGVLGGVLLSAWLGKSGPHRVRRALGQWKRPPAIPARRTSVAMRDTQAAIDGSDLHHFKLVAIGVMPGVVELHGWVPTRAI